MSDEFKILYILVGTFCFSIVMGMVGVAFKLVDPQFVEGLITGSLVTLITMLFKDILNQPNGGANEKTVSTSGNTAVIPDAGTGARSADTNAG